MDLEIKVNIEQLGNGGAFSETSTAFFVEMNSDAQKETFLIDCGHGIFEQVKDKEIDNVLITHTHFDHIGELERLIYYRYFVKGLKTIVQASQDVIDDLKRIYGNRYHKIYKDGIYQTVDMVEFKVYGGTFETYHPGVNSCGFILGNCLFTGDTKASPIIKQTIEENLEIFGETYVFHDYSNFDDEFNNVHACESDIQRVYGDLLNNPKVHFEWVHNDVNSYVKTREISYSVDLQKILKNLNLMENI